MARDRRKTRRVVSTTTRHPGGAPRTHRSCPLGERIEELAAARRLTLPEVAERAGVTRQALNRIRNGLTRNPSFLTLSSVARALGTTVDRLSAGIG